MSLYLEASHLPDLLQRGGHVAATHILHLATVEADEVVMVSEATNAIAEATVTHQNSADCSLVLQQAHSPKDSRPPGGT